SPTGRRSRCRPPWPGPDPGPTRNRSRTRHGPQLPSSDPPGSLPAMIRGRRHCRGSGDAAADWERLRFPEMDRSLWAVMAGTFTLRFSTGLTGAMLGVYLAKLPEHGGPEVAATTLGLLSASFFLSELVLSPAFGILSDRIGHHRVMLFGPVFGAIAVILTGLTTNLFVLGGTRLLEGASTAASVPS